MVHDLHIPPGAFHTITAPDHCAWPNLTLLPNGDIAAVIFNQPSHAQAEGDIELWCSEDSGETWSLRSQITHHTPGFNRMNHAAGLNQAGQLVVLCSGWRIEGLMGDTVEEDVLDAIACVSSDNGHTWTQTSELKLPEGLVGSTPFGNITIDGDELFSTCYTRVYESHRMLHSATHVIRSGDDGQTWEYLSTIGDIDHNEADLLVREGKTWLAAVRMGDCTRRGVNFQPDEPWVQLYTSNDRGSTWQQDQRLTQGGQHNAQLLQLDDGGLLLSFGCRINDFYGVFGRISRDGGQTWSAPFSIIRGLDHRDCGYPSSIQLEDGRIVTAYYARSAPWFQRYHMGIVRWDLQSVGH